MHLVLASRTPGAVDQQRPANGETAVDYPGGYCVLIVASSSELKLLWDWRALSEGTLGALFHRRLL